MSGPHRRKLALAFAVSALVIAVLPRTAAAASTSGSRAAPSASGSARPSGATPQPSATGSAQPSGATPQPSGATPQPSRGTPRPSGGSAARPSAAASAVTRACALPGLVRSDGSRCPGNDRVRRQILGIPDPLHYLNPGQAVTKVAGGVAAGAIKNVALGVIVGWVASSAEAALKDTAKVIGATTRPQLTSSWFSASYWRIAAIATLLTMPFLCAAAIHALVRSDLALLTRAAFGYLPLSLLAVGIASQLTMLLLSAVDEMSSIVGSASAHADGVFLAHTAVGAVATSIGGGDPFVAFLAAIITVAAALTLWVELLVRDAAVYVIVLMLPLFFAAMVWPARRTLAIRAIETLIALILSKFAIVAVLALGGAALGHASIPGPAAMLTGATLVLLAAFSPWALLRMLPLHEVASAAAGGLSQSVAQTGTSAVRNTLDAAGVGTSLGAGVAEWLRPRMLAVADSSPLDGSSDPGEHRSTTPRDRDGRPGAAQRADAGAGLDTAPVGSPGGPLAGSGPADGDAPDGEWSWPPRASGATGAGTGAGTAGDAGTGEHGGGGGATAYGEPGAGGSGPSAAGTEPAAGGSEAPTARPPDHHVGDATPKRRPDGMTPPYVLDPNEPLIVLSEELGALADRGRLPLAPDDPLAARPAPLAADDPLAGAGPPSARDPIGPPATPPAGGHTEAAVDHDDGQAT
jgi:hypothetical protein